MIEEAFPPFNLRLHAGPLTLRLLRDDDLPTYIDLVRAGIHDPDFMPFAVPWTQASDADLPTNMARHLWQHRVELTAQDWSLLLGVWVDGELAGVQELAATDFVTLRTARTGSWLGLRFQGQGIGTAMRQAVCTFAFEHLGARRVTSTAFVDNPASLGVSRKVGYRDNGTSWSLRADQPAESQHLMLGPDDLVRGDHPLTVTGLEAFRTFIGLDHDV